MGGRKRSGSVRDLAWLIGPVGGVLGLESGWSLELSFEGDMGSDFGYRKGVLGWFEIKWWECRDRSQIDPFAYLA